MKLLIIHTRVLLGFRGHSKAAFCYNRAVKSLWVVLFSVITLSASAQLMLEDTTTNEPFFKAKKFNSRAYVGVDAGVGQVYKGKAGMNIGFSLNWVINHKFVVSARYQTPTTQINVQPTVVPYYSNPVYLKHHFAGLAFSYIFFEKKMFSLQPELCAGWASAKFEWPKDLYQRRDWGAVIPAVYGIYNATPYFRLGAGLSYKAVFGPQLFGLKAMDLSGVSGLIFFRVGTF